MLIKYAWVSEPQICELAAVLIKERLKIIGTVEIVFIENSDKVSKILIAGLCTT